MTFCKMVWYRFIHLDPSDLYSRREVFLMIVYIICDVKQFLYPLL